MFTKVLFIVAALLVAVGAKILPMVHHVAQPYKFGYSVKDKHGEQHREEVGDGHSGVKGNYGFTDDRGVHRQVNYVADHAGFRAQVKTNEPGTANQDPAAVNIISSAHPYFGAGYGLGGVGPRIAGLGVAGLGAPVGVAGFGAPVGVGVAGLGAPVGVAGLGAPIGVAGLGAPVGVAGLGAPVGVAGLGAPVGVAGLAAPLGIAGLAAPIGIAGFGAPVGLGIGAPARGLGLGRGIGLGYGSVTGYDSRYGAY